MEGPGFVKKRRRGLAGLDLPDVPDLVRGRGDLPWAWRFRVDTSLSTPQRATVARDLRDLAQGADLALRPLRYSLDSCDGLNRSLDLELGPSQAGVEPAAQRPRTQFCINWEPFFTETGPPRDLPEVLVSANSALPWAWRLPFPDVQPRRR
mmetsp:Transcript_37776/g.70479  ORF Transcript_37776/g.70479 Transcript_37776/m.70479 type:complete len:151 (+) Transcript_37776:66-518(+)